ncbi:enoyl-CoA hydratase-related protein [Pusillimonas sp. ANT_WB101]|uniref:enoyl-CoA hydratase-related protein n=1 Tax=Pusillimonas sp. ANT_WB101 TaxID=2597356 RepID=UPI0011EED8BB|nr:enoyl-CoA hydratase-related protein [Pusillimonas sp. ANT_WB101]KAA0910464.1 enoyl-CoA hydratase [Pusillimonas sp. ANT_WB101]
MSSDTVSEIIVDKDGFIGRLKISNIAKHNSLNFDMWASIPSKLQELADDPQIRVIVLQGDGEKAFASGSDISQFQQRRSSVEDVGVYNRTVEAAVHALSNIKKPTIAHIKGYCFGGGVGIALHCDLRYADETALFCIPAAKVGVGYHPAWLQRLTWLVGPARAKEMMFTAGRYNVKQAQQMGLINDIVGPDAFNDLIASLIALAPLSQLASKLSIDQSTSLLGFDHELCAEAVTNCFNSADYIEGRSAFTEKRSPKFTAS